MEVVVVVVDMEVKAVQEVLCEVRDHRRWVAGEE